MDYDSFRTNAKNLRETIFAEFIQATKLSDLDFIVQKYGHLLYSYPDLLVEIHPVLNKSLLEMALLFVDADEKELEDMIDSGLFYFNEKEVREEDSYYRIVNQTANRYRKLARRVLMEYPSRLPLLLEAYAKNEIDKYADDSSKVKDIKEYVNKMRAGLYGEVHEVLRNYPTPYGITLLELACYRDDKEAVEFLLRNGYHPGYIFQILPPVMFCSKEVFPLILEYGGAKGAIGIWSTEWYGSAIWDYYPFSSPISRIFSEWDAREVPRLLNTLAEPTDNQSSLWLDPTKGQGWENSFFYLFFLRKEIDLKGAVDLLEENEILDISEDKLAFILGNIRLNDKQASALYYALNKLDIVSLFGNLSARDILPENKKLYDAIFSLAEKKIIRRYR